jgi:hypothetical protein
MTSCLVIISPPPRSANHVRCVYGFNSQSIFLGACSTDEIMSSTKIKENDDGGIHLRKTYMHGHVCPWEYPPWWHS